MGCSCLFDKNEDCYGGSPDPYKGPWCQTTEQCSDSPVDCEDDTKIKFLVGPDKKKCNKIKASQCDTEYETKKDRKKKYKLKGKDKKFKCKKIEKKRIM